MINAVRTRMFQKVEPVVTQLVSAKTPQGEDVVLFGEDGPALAEYKDGGWKPLSSVARLHELLETKNRYELGMSLSLWYDQGPWWKMFRPDGKIETDELREIGARWSKSETVAEDIIPRIGEPQPDHWIYQAQIAPSQIHIQTGEAGAQLVEPRVIANVRGGGRTHCAVLYNANIPDSPLPMILTR